MGELTNESMPDILKDIQKDIVQIKATQADHTQDRYKAVRDWATLIIALFGLTSIWFAIVQEWDADKSRRIASYAALAPQWLEVDKALLTYPELRKYFNGQKLKGPDDPNSDRVVALSDLALDTMDNMLTLGELAGYANEMVGWKLTFRHLLENSPTACDRFRHSKNLFGATFAELAEASCGQR